jgi:hypothetical protein
LSRKKAADANYGLEEFVVGYYLDAAGIFHGIWAKVNTSTVASCVTAT